MGISRSPIRQPEPGRDARSGFTFVEVMVTAVIVAILAAVAVPIYTNYIHTQRQQSALALSQTLAITASSLMRRNGGAVPTAAELNAAMPVPLPAQYTVQINSPDATTHFVVITDQSNPADPVTGSSQF